MTNRSKRGRRPPSRVRGAPRTVQTRTAARREPWYRRNEIRVAIAVAAAILLIVVLVLVDRSRDAAAALERRQEGIESFTGNTMALLQDLSGPTSEMVTASADSKSLQADARRWDRVLSGVQQEATAKLQAAPAELDTANRLIFQSILQYIAAAKTYQLVPDADRKLAAEILERATAQVSAADGTWTAGIAVLDEERREADLDPSAIRAPSQVAPAPSPSPTGG